ncbi:MAG: TonB-dependent receptor plug domain-containing protein [Pseudomonadota bacterium]
MLYKTALLSAASVLIGLPGLAQSPGDETATMDTIVVEGSRLNQTATEVGSAVSIITADDIDELGVDFALDAIAAAPGVTINQNGAFGGQATVRIRGASSEQTLVLIDGIPVNDPSSPGGGFNFARVDTENIERIEVLKGAQSTLWGTDAIGGVVSITTKSPEGGFGGSAFAEYGSFNTLRGGASIENGNEQGDFRLAISGTSTDGISRADENDGNTEEDGYEALSLSAKGGVNIGEDARLSADLNWTDADTDIDGFNPGFTDTLDTSESEEFSGNVSLTGSLFNGQLDNLLLVGYSEITRENFNLGVPTFSSEGERTIFRYQGTLDINDRNTLAFGADRDESVARGEETTIDGLFALYEFQPVVSVPNVL